MSEKSEGLFAAPPSGGSAVFREAFVVNEQNCNSDSPGPRQVVMSIDAPLTTQHPTYCPNCGRVDLKGDEMARAFAELLDYVKKLEYVGNRANKGCCGTCDAMTKQAGKIRAAHQRLQRRFWALWVDLLAQKGKAPRPDGRGARNAEDGNGGTSR